MSLILKVISLQEEARIRKKSLDQKIAELQLDENEEIEGEDDTKESDIDVFLSKLDDIKPEVKGNIKPEVKTDIKSEVKGNIKPEVKVNIKPLKKESSEKRDDVVSPTLSRMRKEIQLNKSSISNDLLSRKEFLLQDYYNVYERKIGDKLITDSSIPVLKKLSDHLKCILEVITSNKEFPFQMAVILKLACENKIEKRGDEFWINENRNRVKIGEKEMLIKIKEYREVFFTKCLQIITGLQNDSGDDNREIVKICNKIKLAFEKKIEPEVIELFLNSIKNTEPIVYENPLGTRFLYESIEFTNDRKFYGVTTPRFMAVREKWITNNPGCSIQSFKAVSVFGKFLKSHKLWDTQLGRCGVTQHLGIKFKENVK